MKHLEHLPKLLLVLLFLKGLIFSFDITSALIVGIFSCLVAFYEFKTKEAEFLKLEQDIKHIKEQLELNEQRISKVNDSVTGFKMAQGMKVKF